MAKVTAPILSGRARGQIGKTQVYASWRGIQYARSFVQPRNPRTAAQTSRRDIFSAISDLWKRLGSLARDPWTAATVGRPLTNRNLIISQNLTALQSEVDRAAWIGSPGSGGGVAATSVAAAATATPGELDVTISAPPAPTGWMLASVIAFAMADGLPQALVPNPIAEGENLAPVEGGDTVVTLTGLTSAVDHVVAGWLKWTKPDGSVAYGASLTTLGQPL